MTTRFISNADGTAVSVDLDAVLDAVESDAPGSDPLPEAYPRVLRALGLEKDTACSTDVAAIERALSAGLRTGAFPTTVKLETTLRLVRKRAGSPGEGELPDSVEGFDLVTHLPNPQSEARYRGLIGLDDHKHDLLSVARELRDPQQMRRWAETHHPGVDLPILRRLSRRPPLVVLSGDVGSGKTELAETFGSVLATERDEQILLVRLGLAARGSGLQGQSTQRVQAAFETAKRLAVRAPVILLLDEADALAQSREEAQMHHEDRAGVNALIQAVDNVQDLDGRLIVIMCTNRQNALDPALVRRAALILRFARPDLAARELILRAALGTAVDHDTIVHVASATGPQGSRAGHTASDLVTRLVPRAIRRALAADEPLKAGHLLAVLDVVEPTPPFREDA